MMADVKAIAKDALLHSATSSSSSAIGDICHSVSARCSDANQIDANQIYKPSSCSERMRGLRDIVQSFPDPLPGNIASQATHLKHKPGRQWSANKGRADSRLLVATPDPVPSGAKQLDIFTWSSGENHGFHYLDDFRTGAWVIGIAQGADDRMTPEGTAEFISAASTKDLNIQEDEEEGRRQAEPLRVVAGEAKYNNGEYLSEREPCRHSLDHQRKEFKAHGYDQAAYMESLGFKVVSKNRSMIYVRSHACKYLNILDSNTIYSQIDKTKWDMRWP